MRWAISGIFKVTCTNREETGLHHLVIHLSELQYSTDLAAPSQAPDHQPSSRKSELCKSETILTPNMWLLTAQLILISLLLYFSFRNSLLPLLVTEISHSIAFHHSVILAILSPTRTVCAHGYLAPDMTADEPLHPVCYFRVKWE